MEGDVPHASQLSASARLFAAWMRERVDAGVLAFPLSAFTDDGNAIDPEGFRAHIRHHIDAGAGALFVACGTGEFSALNEREFRDLLDIAVDEAAGSVPLLAGTGYGWSQAQRFAEIAQGCKVDGLLLLPHYLVAAPQSGIVEHVERVAGTTDLPIILYQRGLTHYTPQSLRQVAELPNVIGLKDAHSDFVELQRMTLEARPDFIFFNGTLTAEMQYRPYASIGIGPYSSAIHSCAPEIARAFFTAVSQGDEDTADELLVQFYAPFTQLRDTVPGYAVALVKAVARMRGQRVGRVRAPLVEPSEADLEQLELLIRGGLKLVGAEF